MTNPLDYYARHKAALFPIPAGSKAPGTKEFWEVEGKAASFKHHHSNDPAQWERWQAQFPGCNFAVVAFASGWITVDIDTKGDNGQAEAWALWVGLCKSWGLPDALDPHVQSANGGWHVYFQVPPHIDPATLRQPDALKKRINVRVIGYTLAAGSTFDGKPYVLFDNAPHPAPQALLDHCAPPKPRESVAKVGKWDFDDAKKLYEWMRDNDAIQGDEDWRNAGMVARFEFGDRGIELWEILATRSGGLNAQSLSRWKSFQTEPAGNTVTLKTLFDSAHKMGWKGSVRESVASMFGGVGQLSPGAPPPPSGDVPPPSNPGDEEDSADETAYPTPDGGFINHETDWTAGFVPPDYLVDGVLQRRFCYALTAQTGAGKTTVAMRLAAHVATGESFCGLDVQKGEVLYFAGENPTDVQMRWMGLKLEMGITKPIPVHFISGALHISKVEKRIRREIIEKNLKPSLIIVDTAAAFFEEDNDNDNVQMGNHARRLRSLCTMPGEPCVLILAHPTKGAKDIYEMIPRGGSGFVNEIDGNIGLARAVEGGPIFAQAVHKFRGPEFAPLNFALKVVRNHPLLKDSKGRPIPTIVAEPISESQIKRSKEETREKEDKILKVLCDHPGLGTVAIADALGWKGHSGASILLKSLAEQKLVTKERDVWSVTPRGQKALNLAEQAAANPIEPLPPLKPAELNGVPHPLPRAQGPPMPPF